MRKAASLESNGFHCILGIPITLFKLKLDSVAGIALGLLLKEKT